MNSLLVLIIQAVFRRFWLHFASLAAQGTQLLPAASVLKPTSHSHEHGAAAGKAAAGFRAAAAAQLEFSCWQRAQRAAASGGGIYVARATCPRTDGRCATKAQVHAPRWPVEALVAFSEYVMPVGANCARLSTAKQIC